MEIIPDKKMRECCFNIMLDKKIFQFHPKSESRWEEIPSHCFWHCNETWQQFYRWNNWYTIFLFILVYCFSFKKILLMQAEEWISWKAVLTTASMWRSSFVWTIQGTNYTLTGGLALSYKFLTFQIKYKRLDTTDVFGE